MSCRWPTGATTKTIASQQGPNPEGGGQRHELCGVGHGRATGKSMPVGAITASGLLPAGSRRTDYDAPNGFWSILHQFLVRNHALLTCSPARGMADVGKRRHARSLS